MALIATSKPPCTAWSSVTVKFAVKSALVSVIAGAEMLKVALSSLLMVPVADAVLVMAAIWVAVVPVTAHQVHREGLVGSTTVSPLIVTDTSCDSPTVPAKWIVVVFRV